MAQALTSLTTPASHAAIVVPSDSVDLTAPTRGILVGVTGNIKVTTAGGETVVVNKVPAGIFPMRVTRIWSTSTTATDMTALW